jgi:hypothetical protein
VFVVMFIQTYEKYRTLRENLSRSIGYCIDCHLCYLGVSKCTWLLVLSVVFCYRKYRTLRRIWTNTTTVSNVLLCYGG